MYLPGLGWFGTPARTRGRTLGFLASLPKCGSERKGGKLQGLSAVSSQISKIEPDCVIGKDIFLQGPNNFKRGF